MGVAGGAFGTEKEKNKIFIKKASLLYLHKLFLKPHFYIFTNSSGSTLGAFNV